VKRPRAHEIDDRACRLAPLALPPGWVYREMQRDYGVDGEVEVFRDGLSTGVLFKVQIKGLTCPSFMADERTISFQLNTASAAYLSKELSVPAFLILVDTAKGLVWWHALQLDRSLAAHVARAQQERKKSTAVHVDSTNALPGTADRMFQAFSEAALLISFRSVASAQEESLLKTMSSIPDVSATARSLAKGLSYARHEELQRAWRARDKKQTRALIRDILGDRDAPLFTMVTALEIAEVLAVERFRAIGRGELVPRVKLCFALRQRALTRKGPLHLRLHAAMKLRLARLRSSVNVDYGLYMNSRLCEATAERGRADPFWATALYRARVDAARRIVSSYQQSMRLLEYSAKKGEFYIVAREAVEVLGGMADFLVRLRSEGMGQAEEFWARRLEALADSAIGIAMSLREWELVGLLVRSTLHLVDIRKPVSLDRWLARARDRAAQIPEVEARERLLGSLMEDRATAGAVLTGVDEEQMPLEEEARMIRAMATSLGVDLDDPNDEIAQVVRIGLTDLDPTRVLRTCTHLFLALGAHGLPAVMLGLPTAGSKTLWCTLHGHGIGGMQLDGLMQFMEREHCATCGDRRPQQEGWQWSRPWQAQQHDRHGGARFRGL
jgi:hypothetical protein